MAPLIVTIVLAVTGYLVKYFNDVAIARRKDRLERINLQLKYLYGPLYATARAGQATWLAFVEAHCPREDFFDSEGEASEADKALWRLWMSEVFVPLNVRLEKTIVDNGDLIIEDQIPQCLLDLCSHVAAYKPVIKQWELEDYSEHTSLSNYPNDIVEYAESSYATLKAKQAALLGQMNSSVAPPGPRTESRVER